MSQVDQPAHPTGSDRSPAAVVGVGVAALLIGFVIFPILPFVSIAVVIWWLAEDLRRSASRRPGWLGRVALGGFTVLAVGTAFVVTVFDAHFDCGGTLGGFGEAADARLDTQCRDDRLWRTGVAVVVTSMICAAGAVAVRRSSSSRSPLTVSGIVVGGMITAIVVVVAVLTVS